MIFQSKFVKHGEPWQDEDFVIDKDDGGSPTDDSGGKILMLVKVEARKR